jgi:dihydroorotase
VQCFDIFREVVVKMAFDLFIKNGIVIDPISKVHGKYDIAVDSGRVLSIYPSKEFGLEKSAKKIIDASGCLVTPGLIDIHTHVFHNDTELGIGADLVGVQQGVTTLVDAGSAGATTFPKFFANVVKQNATQVLAWINVAGAGLCSGRAELSDLSMLDTHNVLEMIRQYPIIRGIKVRMSSSVVGASGLRPLEIAKDLSREVRLPLMVHIGNGPPILGDILDILDAGDVVTHAFHGKKGGILQGEEILPQARRALERGVLFDVGHGTSSFSVQTMKKAQIAGIKPYSISTDIYLENFNGPVYSLTTTLSKFLALDFSLDEIIAAVTMAPAAILKMDHEIGSLQVGRIADISVLSIEDGVFEFADSEKEVFMGHQLLRAKFTIKAGKVLKCK